MFIWSLPDGRLFNKGDADINSLVKTVLVLNHRDHVLEVGFGSGKLIHEMANWVSDLETPNKYNNYH